VEKQKYLNLRACVDKPLDFTYCTQDILEILLKNGKGLFQVYQEYISEVIPKEEVGAVADFKPLWLIRRSLE